jgi:hypothetical protein
MQFGVSPHPPTSTIWPYRVASRGGPTAHQPTPIRIENSTPAMDYHSNDAPKPAPEIRPYARSVRKTGLGEFTNSLGRRRPDLGAGIAARLARCPPSLRQSPRRRRLEPPRPTAPVQQIPRPTPPLPADRPALRRTPGVSTSSPARGLTLNFVRCLI